jgi:ATP-dependent RNA helicase RhlE
LFSATFSDEIRGLAKTITNNPVEIDVAPRNSTLDVISQKIHPVDKSRKADLLSHLIRSEDWYQVLVFSRTKHGSDKLVKRLSRDNINAAAIHGNKSQSQRTKALAAFKHNKIQVLVATDIAARGIDIDQLSHVVNFDLPNVPEDYIHRIGRTGRAGASGNAISLVTADEIKQLTDIERLMKRKIEREEIEGFEPEHAVPESSSSKSARKPYHSNNGGNNNQRRRGGNDQMSHGKSRNPGSSHNRSGNTGRRGNSTSAKAS